MDFFTKDSQGVKAALYMFAIGKYTSIEQVPDLYNLRKVVQQELDSIK